MPDQEAIDALAEALEDAEETLGFSRSTPFPDPAYHETVKELGRRIGFGALMSTAEAAWKEVAAEQRIPEGTEFVCGPTRSQYNKILRTVSRARALLRSRGFDIVRKE